ncbi:MAG: GNAT family N-acetyltransferase, partial [Pseudomonadota bacterium]
MFDNYCQAWINSVTYDDFADQSPGEMVLYLMIEQLIEEGYTKLDLGIGAERYKYSWCREDKKLFDVLMPLSAGAVPLMLMLKAKTHLKAKLRNDERVWKHIRRVRRFLGNLR